MREFQDTALGKHGVSYQSYEFYAEAGIMIKMRPFREALYTCRAVAPVIGFPTVVAEFRGVWCMIAVGHRVKRQKSNTEWLRSTDVLRNSNILASRGCLACTVLGLESDFEAERELLLQVQTD